MGILVHADNYQTLKVRFDEDICFIQMYRPDANNAINDTLIRELSHLVDLCEQEMKIVVLEGLPEVFSFGADFSEIQQSFSQAGSITPGDPEPMYDLWQKLASGPFISIAHVRGQANAGGIGFVAACDIAICEERATFGLSEMLFGLIPACVLPFLIRKVGRARANSLTLTTEPILAEKALQWGLVDDCADNSQNLLRKKLLRLRRLSKAAISRQKTYMNSLDSYLAASKAAALKANTEVFSDRENIAKISRYVETGQFPWE